MPIWLDHNIYSVQWRMYFSFNETNKGKMLIFKININGEANRGAGAQSATVKANGCGFDPHPRKLNFYLNLSLHFFTLVMNQIAVCLPPHSTQCVARVSYYTRLPLPSLQYAGYNVKLIKKLEYSDTTPTYLPTTLL